MVVAGATPAALIPDEMAEIPAQRPLRRVLLISNVTGGVIGSTLVARL
jgi:hypothetical protein